MNEGKNLRRIIIMKLQILKIQYFKVNLKSLHKRNTISSFIAIILKLNFLRGNKISTYCCNIFTFYYKIYKKKKWSGLYFVFYY